MGADITTTDGGRAGGLSAADSLALARLFQLVSPALPIGGFAYSEALEYAVEAGWVTDEADTQAWVLGRLDDNVGRLDAPIFARLWRVFRDARVARDAGDVGGGDGAGGAAAAELPPRALEWSRLLWALRESAELRAADRDMGRSLARLLVALGVAAAAPWVEHPQVSYAAVFALAAVERDIALVPAMCGFLYAWSEAQVVAAVKLVPLGQSAGQRVLVAVGERLPAVVERALGLPDDELGAGAPGLAIASSQHETMYVRLFRS
ncbi:MAG: urease accessory protein UreF [Haliangiales bacterium]